MTYLLLTPSGAGGHAPSLAAARAARARLQVVGWILHCRHAPVPRERHRAVVTVVDAFGPGGRAAVEWALTVAGGRHGILYHLAGDDDAGGPAAGP